MSIETSIAAEWERRRQLSHIDVDRETGVIARFRAGDSLLIRQKLQEAANDFVQMIEDYGQLAGENSHDWFDFQNLVNCSMAEAYSEKKLARGPRPPLAEIPGHFVYRHYSEHDVLLYVGYSSRIVQRQREHSDNAGWWDHSYRSHIEAYSTRDEALAAELRAIHVERPLWNVQGNAR